MQRAEIETLYHNRRVSVRCTLPLSEIRSKRVVVQITVERVFREERPIEQDGKQVEDAACERQALHVS